MRLALVPIFGRVKARQRLANDFLLGVAHQPSGAAVPQGHAPHGVQPVDAVIGHAVHQQAKRLFALLQGVLGRHPLRDVARHVRKAAQLSGLVAQRRDVDVRVKFLPALGHALAFLLIPALRGGRS